MRSKNVSDSPLKSTPIRAVICASTGFLQEIRINKSIKIVLVYFICMLCFNHTYVKDSPVVSYIGRKRQRNFQKHHCLIKKEPFFCFYVDLTKRNAMIIY